MILFGALMVGLQRRPMGGFCDRKQVGERLRSPRKVSPPDLSEAPTGEPGDGDTHGNFCMHEGDVT